MGKQTPSYNHVYSRIQNVVDFYINHISDSDNKGIDRREPFDYYFKQTPSSAFAKILHKNYHCIKTYKFFDTIACTHPGLGIFVPRDLEVQISLACLSLPKFVLEIQKLYDSQPLEERKKSTV